MRRLLIYAHFDPDDAVTERVRHTLAAFKSEGWDVVFATTSAIGSAGRDEIGALVEQIIEVENIGYDYFAWKTAIDTLGSRLRAYDRLILLNSSVVGPVFSLGRFLSIVEQRPGDLVAATVSHEHVFHIQSYFLYVKRQALHSDVFHAFWASVRPLSDRRRVIADYELTMTDYFVSRGLTVATFYAGRDRKNPTLSHPYRLLLRRFPFVKVQLLRDNPRRVVVWPLRLLSRWRAGWR